MAKRRTFTASFLLRPQVRDFLSHHFSTIAGFFGSIVCLVLITTLVSYSPVDPSFNTELSNSKIANLLSWPGSFVSDLLLQTFGFSSYLLLGGFLFLSLCHLTGSELRYSTKRHGLLIIIGAFILTLPLAFALSQKIGVNQTYFLTPTQSYGGAFGELLLKGVYGAFSSSVGIAGSLFVCFVLSFLGLLTYGAGLCLSPTLIWTGCLKLSCVLQKKIHTSMIVTKQEIALQKEPLVKKDSLAKNDTVILACHPSEPKVVFSQSEPVVSALDEELRDDDIHEESFDAEINPTLATRIKHKLEEAAATFFQDEVSHKEAPHSAADTSSFKQESSYQPVFEKAYVDYSLPSIELLDDPLNLQKNKLSQPLSEEELLQSAALLKEVLADFGVKGEIESVLPGPVVTMYELKPAAGIKSSRVIGLADDIARSMSALSARIATIPGRNVIGIELPNKNRETVFLRSLLESSAYSSSSAKLPLILGKDIAGQAVLGDLARMPHLLIAGTTGSGKSVGVNAMILSLLYKLTPKQCKFILIDPKMLEFSIYDGIPHLLTPVVTDPKKAVVALKWAVREMENRYRSMAKIGVRNIDGFNERIKEAKSSGEILVRRVQTGFDPDTGKPVYENQTLDLTPLPYIVVVVDEMADLMMVAGKEIESAVQRLAQMARAAGIHLIMATQRPSVDVITGTIKANFPTRISFQVTSKFDSRTILGEQGAEQLLGQGDMLYMAGGGRITRVHGPFCRDDEVEGIVGFLKSQGEPDYIDAVTQDLEEAEGSDSSKEETPGADPLFNQARDLIIREQKASTSFIQRHLQIGYNRAARIIDQLEKRGDVSAPNHVGKREVLIK